MWWSTDLSVFCNDQHLPYPVLLCHTLYSRWQNDPCGNQRENGCPPCGKPHSVTFRGIKETGYELFACMCVCSKGNASPCLLQRTLSSSRLCRMLAWSLFERSQRYNSAIAWVLLEMDHCWSEVTLPRKGKLGKKNKLMFWNEIMFLNTHWTVMFFSLINSYLSLRTALMVSVLCP